MQVPWMVMRYQSCCPKSSFTSFSILLTGNPGSILFPVHVQCNILFMWPISNKCMKPAYYVPHTNIDFVCDLESRRAGLRWRKTRRRRRLSWLTDSLSRLLVHFLSVCCLHVSVTGVNQLVCFGFSDCL